jgi:hypothetical protein
MPEANITDISNAINKLPVGLGQNSWRPQSQTWSNREKKMLGQDQGNNYSSQPKQVGDLPYDLND